MKKAALFIYLLFSVSRCLFAQPRTGADDPEMAKEHFSHRNYLMAMPIYKSLVKKEPQNILYNFRLAQCYLNTNLNKTAAIPFLEFLTKTENDNDEYWFYLGKAYSYANRFDDALGTFEVCKGLAGDYRAKADRQLEMCNNAIEFKKFPKDITYVNLGKQINTQYPDYYPIIAGNESFLIFTTRKPFTGTSQVEIDGYYSSDIYISYPKDGVWQKPKSIGPQVNTGFDEQAVDLTSDGKALTVYIDHIDTIGNIYFSEFAKNIFQKLMRPAEQVNAGFETSGSITSERNMIAFASKRSNGYGETDIYLLKKLPNGNWAVPQLLPNTINTKYSEDFPRFTDDGKILYFASEGHSSMGGYDIFKAGYDNETNTWTTPENLGYPINGAGDDYTISFTHDSSYAYMSAAREEGMGDLDLYKLKFNNNTNRFCIVTGYVTTSDTSGMSVKKQILVTKADSKENFRYTPVKSSGKYIMALLPGKYTITVKAAGYQEYSFLQVIYDVPFNPEQQLDFQLTKEVQKK